ncbi:MULTISPECIES: hypothetical protein [Methylobacterium]|jgi:hypothetical protein|uniref:Transposase n=1 Tax=Methylobacterium jeotgali TaxID=381630 RepID=A0ABQ4SYE4_9HYPH|nr:MULTISPECIES: hypothetical protein [Methylobacterium]PIU08055.1 MAG: hypothetical protein COT56_02795 [Methylobacterium sp. CG09_land_8_20_14_0_10_71_15]PIU14644.1 MAG: hypothetical protein COT28_07125 [Methylobacterium sp. CG08_land_8_20_14_0_20_71_15]GBU18113.1 hypothetical protein AwMethylo_23280 [Methylobacterium sp.]GJE06965.1 hypothetical protein AOPFMNJM_2288 [Methylobacterium jeotgali]
MARGTATGPGRKRVVGRRRLRPEEIADLVREIRTWDYAREPLTWDAVINFAEGLFGHRWRRQTLEGHDAIKKSFQKRQEEGPRKARRAPRDAAMALYAKQVEALKEENRLLAEKLAAYEQRFARWAVNAFLLKGLTEGELDAKLLPTDRGQTDPKLKGGVK